MVVKRTALLQKPNQNDTFEPIFSAKERS